MKERWTQLYVRLAGAIVLAAALDRFVIAAGNMQILSLPEPLMAIPLRYAMLLVGGLELVVSLICLLGRRTATQIAWIAWLAINYWTYRVGLHMVNCGAQATCIGSPADPLCLSHGTPGLIAYILPFYMLLGSCAVMVWFWWENKRAESAKFVKISCPGCGVHIRFDDRNLGQKISCPMCAGKITLRRPGNIKMACFFCKEHIEFPAHSIGEKMPCPHCQMDITLKEPA